jgi:hypothetical protein
MTAMSMDDVPHSTVTPAYSVTVRKNFHRFSFNNRERREWTVTDRDGNLMLGSYVMRLGEIPIYFLTARAGMEFMKRRGFIRPVLGEFPEEFREGSRHMDPEGLLQYERGEHPFRQKRATVVDNELQAYVVDDAQKATLYEASKRSDVNYISFPLSPVNVLDRRWSGDRTFDHANNIFSGHPTIEDLRHFLQVLYDELEVSIIKGMEDPNLLSLQDLYTYDTV